MHHLLATSKRQGGLKAPAGENREIGLTSLSIIVSSLKVSGPER